MNNEDKRQLVHVLVGVAALLLLFTVGRWWLLLCVFMILLVGSLFINRKMQDKNIYVIDWFVQEFERKKVRFPGWGSACIATGTLILVAYLQNPLEIAAILLLLGISDALSTVVGRNGHWTLPWNKKKTAEGSVAFFAGGLAGWLFVGQIMLPVAAVATLVESIDSGIDDNLLVPIVCVVLFSVF